MTIEDLSIADDPAFSDAPFVTAKAVKVGVDLMPLILSRTLNVQSFRLEEPQAVVLNSPSGQWNFSGLGGQGSASSSDPAGGSTAAMGVVIRKLEIVGGRLLVGKPGFVPRSACTRTWTWPSAISRSPRNFRFG